MRRNSQVRPRQDWFGRVRPVERGIERLIGPKGKARRCSISLVNMNVDGRRPGPSRRVHAGGASMPPRCGVRPDMQRPKTPLSGSTESSLSCRLGGTVSDHRLALRSLPRSAGWACSVVVFQQDCCSPSRPVGRQRALAVVGNELREAPQAGPNLWFFASHRMPMDSRP